MKKQLIFVLTTVMLPAHVFALDCDPLKPGKLQRSVIETEVEGSANTLFKIGEAEGGFKNKVINEVESIFESHPDANRTEVKNRLIYLYCTMLDSSKSLADDEKFNRLRELSNSLLDVPDEKDTPKEISRAYKVSTTKNDHPSTLSDNSKDYEESFEADPGYRIVRTEWRPSSVNNADNIVQNISADRKSVSMKYKLTSGPAVDRWRGWIKGDLIIYQEKI